MTHRERLNKDLSRIKAKVHHKYFPEYLKGVYKDWEGQASLIILKEIPLPSQIVQMSPEEIVQVIKEKAGRGIEIKRAKKLKGVAAKTVDVKDGLEMASLELNNLLHQYELLNQQLLV